MEVVSRERILNLLTDGLLRAVGASEDYLNAVLEGRFQNSFESEWLKRWDKVACDPSSSSAECSEVREKAFLIAFRKCGNDEIAGLISDDFGLMHSFAVLGLADEWVKEMLEVYERGDIPY